MRLDRAFQSVREARQRFRPIVFRLEDRLVPGETMGASMPWATAFGLLAQDSAPAARVESSEHSAVTRVTDDSANDASNVSISPAKQIDGARDIASALRVGDTDAQDAVFSSDDLSDTAAAPMASMAMPSGLELMNEHAITNEGASGAMGLTSSSQAAPAMAMGLPNFAANNAVGAALASEASAGGASPMLTFRSLSKPGPFASPATPYGPAQIRHAYGFDQLSQTGAGQTIYIIDAFADPNISSDLQTFDAHFGLSNPNFTVHQMSSRIRSSTSWGVEESLDVEWAHAIAPAANIVLVEATSNSNSNLYAAVDWATSQGAHIVSMSWGGGDASGESSNDSHFNHSGVSYVASSGDSGGVVEYPSASPYVLSVGGTNLPLDASGNRIGAETAWSSGGGGASVGESEPGYQTAYGISLSGRGTPDVSYDADPNTGFYVYDSFHESGALQVGGTSAGAPQWAALIALVDQSRSTPLSTNNLTSRTEYNAATGTVYASNYTDITSGSNGFSTTVGYDLATGVGTPIANNLVPWMINNS